MKKRSRRFEVDRELLDRLRDGVQVSLDTLSLLTPPTVSGMTRG
jgi:hypothetical protein